MLDASFHELHGAYSETDAWLSSRLHCSWQLSVGGLCWADWSAVRHGRFSGIGGKIWWFFKSACSFAWSRRWVNEFLTLKVLKGDERNRTLIQFVVPQQWCCSIWKQVSTAVLGIIWACSLWCINLFWMFRQEVKEGWWFVHTLELLWITWMF